MKLTGNEKVGDGTDKGSGVGRAVGTRKRRGAERASALVGEREKGKRWMTERATREEEKTQGTMQEEENHRQREAGEGIKVPRKRERGDMGVGECGRG
jgi:hypothetical protein